MKELEQEMGITIMRVNEGKWEAVDGVVVSHLGGFAAPCPWLVEKIAGFTHEVCLKKQGFWRRVLQRCRSDQRRAAVSEMSCQILTREASRGRKGYCR